MNDFEQISKIWTEGQTEDIPSVTQIIEKVSTQSAKLRRKILFELACLFLALASTAFVTLYIHFRYSSTYIAVALMWVAIIGIGILRYRQTQFLKRINYTITPALLLQQFEAFYKKQKWISGTGNLWYFIILNIAFGLYFYEMIYRSGMSPLWQIICVSIYILWMLIAYFYLGKKQKRAEQKRVENIINHLKNMEASLEEK